MNPLTPAELARCGKAWADIQAIDRPATQGLAVGFFAGTWIDRLLVTAAGGTQPVWDSRAYPNTPHDAAPGARGKVRPPSPDGPAPGNHDDGLTSTDGRA